MIAATDRGRLGPHRHVGIDFGTTNTAVGLADDGGDVRLALLPGAGGASATTWRTVLFFEPDAPPLAGAPAIDRFLAVDGDGRLVQSIKSHLASASFTRTGILQRTYTLEALIALYLQKLRAAAPCDLGSRAVIGRPVRYWGARDAADEARAVARMRAALGLAGFADVVFEYEPVAAALRYASTLDHDELILVADFGGGTSDFSLARVGPKVVPGDNRAILATHGLPIGGDSFDARVIDALVAPALGLGTHYRDEMGARTPVPGALFGRLRRWHHLSFLKEPATLHLLERLQHGAEAPAAKVALSESPRASLEVDDLPLHLPMERAGFDGWIAPELDAIDAAVTGVLDAGGVSPGDVDTVFATGGSSLVPAVRQRLAARFGDGKLAGGEELTSVAWGLAARARQVFGAAA
ncbi:MAG TPA: Hsp70 family protein [Polyangia bacterium]|nr:Hsp70 family protein [Polyangia bacterium]